METMETSTRTASSILAGAAVAFAVFATSAFADTRGSVRGGISSPVAPPSGVSPITMTALGGGISNTTSGTVTSGGNTGGHVETGDENVSIHVVNIGPTNSNTTVTNKTEEEVPAEPSCDDSRLSRCPQGVRNR